MTDYEYLSSVPLQTLLAEHPLAESYLENLRLGCLPRELPLLDWAELSAQEREQVLSGNALRLLGPLPNA